MCLDRIQGILEEAQQLVDAHAEEDGVVEHYESLIYKLSLILHPYNYLILDIKQKLALLYGNIPQFSMDTMSRPAKQRKVQLCMDVMDCLGKVRILKMKMMKIKKKLSQVDASGYTPWRVKMLSELTKTKVSMAREDYSQGIISKKDLESVLLQNKFLLLYIAYQQATVAGRGD